MDKMVDLGNERLSISRHLGNSFALQLESDKPSDSTAINSARDHLLSNSSHKLIGVRVEPGGSLKDIEQALSFQMGLPQNSGFTEIGDRITGREKDFLVVILGNSQLGLLDKLKLTLKLKILGVKSVTEG